MRGPEVRVRVSDHAQGALTAADVVRLEIATRESAGARALVLEGAGAVFCAGLDLAHLGEIAPDAGEIADRLRTFAGVLRGLDTLACPVVAVVEGAAAGGGVGLACVADVVIAGPRATFSLPETLIGLVPGVIFPYVARRVGVAAAKRLAMGTPSITAEEACRIGLVDHVSDDPPRMLRTLLTRFDRTAPRAVAALKQLVATHFGAAAYEADAIACFAELAASANTRARVARFVGGRAPWLEDEA
jgi:enoyl-CoA hydratase/carnithine racemase